LRSPTVALRALSLNQVDATVDDAIAFGHALRVNTTLRELNLSRNPRIGSQGFIAIAEALRDSNRTLRKLCVVQCGDVSLAAAQALGSALGANDALRFLDLDSNNIELQLFSALVEGLHRNRALRHLACDSSALSSDDVSRLVEVLCRADCMSVLDCAAVGGYVYMPALIEQLDTRRRNKLARKQSLEQRCWLAVVFGNLYSPAIIRQSLPAMVIERLLSGCELTM
jgi:Leucine Rich repeat